MEKEIIAIIPAKGQSKGVPRKNIRLLLGKPLIWYSIQAAKSVKNIKRVFVSTEDKEIAEISKKFGAEIIKRPIEYAKDESPTNDVISHILDTLNEREKYEPSTIVLLQPTSPLRESKNIKEALELFQTNKCGSVISICEVLHPIQWTFEIVDNGFLKPAFNEKYLGMRRQELTKYYLPNGAIFITSLSNFREKNSFYCHPIMPYIMPPEISVDLDTELDFIIAESLLKLKTI